MYHCVVIYQNCNLNLPTTDSLLFNGMGSLSQVAALYTKNVLPSNSDDGIYKL